ncbi:MAG: enoyl-CoA hydratase/isomerase family protein [Gemmatimonadales bacterium]
MSGELPYSVEGPVHRLTLNRPSRRNALTPALARELALAIDGVEEIAEAEAVVLGGAGGHFCAGLDLHWLRSLGPEASVADLQRGLSDFQAAVLSIVRCPVPVIAMIAGTVAGFGLDLALACDFRVAAAGASFTSAFARMGLVPDGGSTFTLPRLVGTGPALRLLLAGESIDASRAQAIGLVDEVVDDAALEQAVRGLTERLSANAPSSIRTIKRLVRAPEIGALEQALSTEGAAQVQALQGAEFRRRLESFAARLTARTDRA